MNTFQLAAIAIVAVILALVLKNQRPEIALILSMAVGIFILINSLGKIKSIIDTINDFSRTSGIDGEYIGILLRIVGIAYVTEFISEICRDAGENAIASKLEIAGKLTILTMAIPIMVSVMKLLTTVIR
jgi:stage III sporulation protein AD